MNPDSTKQCLKKITELLLFYVTELAPTIWFKKMCCIPVDVVDHVNDGHQGDQGEAREGRDRKTSCTSLLEI